MSVYDFFAHFSFLYVSEIGTRRISVVVFLVSILETGLWLICVCTKLEVTVFLRGC
jgi:hypothetical protein